MSQYLNFYLKPKNSDEPILFQSMSHNNEGYEYFSENLSIPVNIDSTRKYSELTVDDMQIVIDDVERAIQDWKKRMDRVKEAYSQFNNLSSEKFDEYLSEYLSDSEYLETLQTAEKTLRSIYSWVYSVYNTSWGGFEKVLINIT